MKRTWYKIIFGLLKKVFIGLLSGLVNGCNHAKWLNFRYGACSKQGVYWHSDKL